jgi:sulfur relay (sulfurtransferase) complex TusBCD TusD component (DsrE family)
MDARAIKPELLVEGAKRNSMDELSAWTQEADKVIIF